MLENKIEIPDHVWEVLQRLNSIVNNIEKILPYIKIPHGMPQKMHTFTILDGNGILEMMYFFPKLGKTTVKVKRCILNNENHWLILSIKSEPISSKVDNPAFILECNFSGLDQESDMLIKS